MDPRHQAAPAEASSCEPGPAPPAPSAVPAAAAGLAVLGALFLVAALAAFHGSRGDGYDLAAYLEAARRLVSGLGLYQPETLAGPFSPGPGGLYLYPPPLAVLLVPLAALGGDAPQLAWLVTRVAALGLACALIPVPRYTRLATFGVTALSLPTLLDLNLGNVSVLVLLATAVGWRWLDRAGGAVASALGMAVRPQLGILLPWWLARRRPGPAAWVALTGVALVAVTLPIVGSVAYIDYAHVLRNLQNVAAAEGNVSFAGVAVGAGLAEPLPTLAFGAGAVLAIAAMAAALRDGDAERAYLVTVTGSLLVAPLLWPHYLVALALPAAYLASHRRPLALALPLLGWLPAPLLPWAALVATFAPLAVPPHHATGDGRGPTERVTPGELPRT